MTAIIRLIKRNEAKGAHPQRDQQHNDITNELCRLAKILPDHKVLDMTESELKRLQTALNKANGFQLSQLESLDKICDRALANTVKVIRKAENNGIESWIQEILDPQKGYSKAHAWTRGTPKAPPLPVEMWKGSDKKDTLTKLRKSYYKNGQHYGPNPSMSLPCNCGRVLRRTQAESLTTSSRLLWKTSRGASKCTKLTQQLA